MGGAEKKSGARHLRRTCCCMRPLAAIDPVPELPSPPHVSRSRPLRTAFNSSDSITSLSSVCCRVVAALVGKEINKQSALTPGDAYDRMQFVDP